MSYKEWFGIIATVIAFISYIPYFRDIFADKTKPNAVTWLVWAILTAIGFLGQISGNAGPGAWAAGASTLIATSVFGLALIKGQQNIVKTDFIMLGGAAAALILWFVTKQPVLSVILITIVDMFGFVPTIRKSWNRPHEETLITFALSAVKHTFSLVAIVSYSLVTTLYPAYLVLANLVFITLLYSRRKQLAL